MSSRLAQNKQTIIIFVSLFALFGALFLLITKAATPSLSVEPENGQIQSPASSITDSTASAGKAIKFGDTVTPPPPPGDPTKPVGLGQANGPSGTWNLKLNDNFDGTTLNTANWSTGWLGTGITPPVQSQETACYDPKQVVVEGGFLHLKAERRDINCNKGTNPHPYASGAINSDGKKSYSYGYFESRMWLDVANNKVANWPAWWLDGQPPWPSNGELDIMEGLSGSAKGNWHGPQDGGAGKSLGGLSGAAGGGWHVFAAEWAPGIVTAFYDGVKVGSYSSTSNITSSPQFLILGMQMSPENQYGGPVKAPTEMTVDYVRVWQK